MPTARVILVGGFLGAGKTTLLRQASERLARQGKRVGLIANAAGEAALGWLNAAARLEADGGAADWRAFCLEFLRAAQASFRSLSAEVAHFKVHLATGGSALVANLTENEGTPSMRGTVPNAPQASLLVNVRAHVDPRALETVVRSSLQAAVEGRARLVIDELETFSPARPRPIHRYHRVV